MTRKKSERHESLSTEGTKFRVASAGQCTRYIDVFTKMNEHGISLARVATPLRQYAIAAHDIEKIVIAHTGKRYSIVVLLSTLSRERVVEVDKVMEDVRPNFLGNDLSTYVFGPKQRGMDIFSATDSYVLHDENEGY